MSFLSFVGSSVKSQVRSLLVKSKALFVRSLSKRSSPSLFVRSLSKRSSPVVVLSLKSGDDSESW